ncbi:MAG: DUF1653 domain-containing protein [Pseudomonadota bacterium]
MRLTSGLGGLIRQPAQPEPAPEAAPTHPNGWFATHLHKKGGKYRVIMHAVLEADRSDVVIYDDAEGAVWVRPVSEFYDGRFAPLSDGEQ